MNNCKSCSGKYVGSFSRCQHCNVPHYYGEEYVSYEATVVDGSKMWRASHSLENRFGVGLTKDSALASLQEPAADNTPTKAPTRSLAKDAPAIEYSIEYSSTGTSTGRVSSAKPNKANKPRMNPDPTTAATGVSWTTSAPVIDSVKTYEKPAIVSSSSFVLDGQSGVPADLYYTQLLSDLYKEQMSTYCGRVLWPSDNNKVLRLGTQFPNDLSKWTNTPRPDTQEED